MNTKIKFRALTRNRIWVYGNLIQGEKSSCYICLINKNPIYKNGDFWYIDSPCYKVIPETVGQFTGIKDKAEKEIWEGDILEFPFEMGIAYVINDGFRFGLKSPGSEAVDYEGETVFKQLRVIGNIYQNPELLSTPTAVL